ncbi:MAG: hypothetical protein ACI4NM_09710 [Bullifex sp.]
MTLIQLLSICLCMCLFITGITITAIIRSRKYGHIAGLIACLTLNLMTVSVFTVMILLEVRK